MLGALKRRTEGFVIVASIATPLAKAKPLDNRGRLWRCFSEQQCCAHIGVAPPLAVTLGNERDLMPLPRLKREPACLIAPRHRVENPQAEVVATPEQARFMVPQGVAHSWTEADLADLALQKAINDIGAGQHRGGRCFGGIDRGR